MTKLLSLAAVAALALAPAATAQTRLVVGGGFDVDREAAYLGAGVRAPMGTLPLTLAPHADVYFRDNATDLQGNVDALYHFQGRSFSPYIGAGLGVQYFKPKSGDSSTDVGANLLFGADFGGVRLKPYVQARITTGLGGAVGIGGGFVF